MKWDPDHVYAHALEKFADEEFCWNCATLLENEATFIVVIPEGHYGGRHRNCCSRDCAIAALQPNATPQMTVDQARSENPVDWDAIDSEEDAE